MALIPTDLIIIGSGAAGLRAGIHALENGLSAVIVEKRKTTGGNTRISDGGIAASKTDLQKAEGIKDAPEKMKADMMKAGLHKNSEALVDTVVHGAREAFEWTRSIGVDYEDHVMQFGGHSLPRCYTPVSVSGKTLVQKAGARYQALGGHLLKATRVLELLYGHGRVTGVKVQNVHGTKTLYAQKGVLIASGGFGADASLLKTCNAAYASLDTTNLKTATGEMIHSARQLGAATVDMQEIQIAPWTSPKEKGFGHAPKFGDYIVLLRGILVDKNTGTRFVNELADRKTVADAILATGSPVLGIADAKAVKSSHVDISKALKNQSVLYYDDLEALAKAFQVDSQTLEKTVQAFNRAVQTGKDEAFNKPLDATETIDTPPYYVMEIWPKVHFTMGGLKIDPSGRVLSEDDAPVPGLYAAGEVTGGVHGASRLGSCAITDALVMGKVAVKTLLGPSR